MNYCFRRFNGFTCSSFIIPNERIFSDRVIINVHSPVHKLMFSYEITSPTDARNSFFKLLDRVVENHQVLIINRRDGENVALIAESDLTSLIETVYLLRSPANGRRLLDAIASSKSGKIQPQTIDELKQELGIGEEEQTNK